MNIAIIEYQNDIDEALKYFPPHDCLYLSVSAEASYNLSKRHIKFVTDEDVLTPEEFKQIGNENFGITKEWIQHLEEILQSKDPIFSKRQFYPFRWHFYRLKILLDAVRIRRILVERLICKEKPLSIGAPVAAIPGKIHDHHLFFHKHDSLYGLLIQRIAAKKRIEVRTWKETKAVAGNFIIIDRIKTCLNLRRLISGLKKVLKTVYLFKIRRSRGNILLGKLGYDIAPIRQKLSDRFNFYIYKNPLYVRSLKSFFKLKSGTQGNKFPEIRLKSIFNVLNVTGDSIVDEILGERVQTYAERFIPILWQGLNYLESVDCKKKFRAYIDSVGASDSFYGLPTYYFSREKKPVITVQHGAYGIALNQNTEYCEFGHDGWFLAWGDGIKEMYEERRKGDCKIISTGSHLIGEIRKKSMPRKIISKVCYVPNSYRGYGAYYPNAQPCLDSRMFILQTNFMLTLKSYSQRYQITYKISPTAARESSELGKDPMLKWLKETLPSVQIKSAPLESIIHEFDLFIIDWPSTTLVQVCATMAEVIVYTGNKYHVPTRKAIELLEKRAIVGKSEEDFQNKIRNVLEKGVVISNVEDTSFIEKYGIYKNDGKSLTRMIDNVENILGEKNSKKYL